MRLNLSVHALERMAERDITEADIVALIRNCTKPRRDIKDNPIYHGFVAWMGGAGRHREGVTAATSDHREGNEMKEGQPTPYMTYDPEVNAAYVYLRVPPWDHHGNPR